MKRKKSEKVNLPITERNLPQIERKAARRADYFNWDPNLKGFGVRIRDGNLSWIFQYKFGGAHHRIRLGGKELSCNQARELANAERGKLSKARLGHGSDPATERDEKKLEAKPGAKTARTFAATISMYLEARRDGLKPSTYEAQDRHLHTHWRPLHDIALAAITRADVAGVLTTITKSKGPVSANRARSTLQKFFTWAIGEGMCDHNPVVGTNKREENEPRERSLSDAETAVVWLAAPDNDYGRNLKMILLTGCRRDEIGSLRWSEIDMGARTITLPRERTKNRKEHVVPLTDGALAILSSIDRNDREFVFGRTRAGGYSGWSKSKGQFDGLVSLKEPWTVHDLRRTVRTGLGKLGIQPHVAEAALNHLPPKLIRTYDRNTYAEEKRAALDQWATHLKRVVAQATGANVTALRKGDGRKP
jgi:integrase